MITSTSNVFFFFSLPPVVSPNLRFFGESPRPENFTKCGDLEVTEFKELAEPWAFSTSLGGKDVWGLACCRKKPPFRLCVCRWKHQEVLASYIAILTILWDSCCFLHEPFFLYTFFFCLDVSEDGTMIRQVDWQRAI